MEPLDGNDPESIGPYRLLARLGAGGMGRVYLARSAGGRTVAVKVVRPELAEDQEFRSRFRQEVAAARAVDGAYTAPVTDADPDGPVPWLATAYVLGPSLTEAVAAHGPLPEHSVRALGAGLAEALAAVHRAGLVHRDLKPSNVLLAADGPRVIDFGIARAIDGNRLTGTGIVVGSPGYMCPEQAMGQVMGPAGDVFSLASVLVYAATGRGPFESGSGQAAQLYKLVHDQPELDGLPESLRSAVTACLAKDPARRPGPEQLVALLAPEGLEAVLRDGWLPAPVASALAQHAAKVMDMETPARGNAAYTPTSANVPVAATGTIALGRAAASPTAPTFPASPSRQPRPSRRAFLIGGGATVAAVAGAAAWKLFPGGPGPGPTPAPTSTSAVPVPSQSRPPGVPPQPLWTYNAQGFRAPKPLLLAGGSLFPAGDTLLALDPVTGKEKWTRPDLMAPNLVAGAGMVIDGSALAGYAEDSGQPRWTAVRKAPNGMSLSPDTVLAADDHTVYTLALTGPPDNPFNTTAGVAAIAIDSGQVLWFQPRKKGTDTSVTAFLRGGNLYYTDDKGNLVARSGQDGRQLWFAETASSNAFPAAADDTQAYCVADGNGLQAVRLSDGRTQWKISVPAGENRRFGAVLAADKLVYGSDGSASVCAWEAATGKEVWRCPLPRVPEDATPPVKIHDTLFVPGRFGEGVYAVNTKQASLRWTFKNGIEKADTWCLSTDGERLFALFGSTVYALPPE